MTLESRKKTYFSLPRPLPPRPPAAQENVLPVYGTDGSFQGAFIAGTWWWPEDVRLFFPELQL